MCVIDVTMRQANFSFEREIKFDTPNALIARAQRVKGRLRGGARVRTLPRPPPTAPYGLE